MQLGFDCWVQGGRSCLHLWRDSQTLDMEDCPRGVCIPWIACISVPACICHGWRGRSGAGSKQLVFGRSGAGCKQEVFECVSLIECCEADIGDRVQDPGLTGGQTQGHNVMSKQYVAGLYEQHKTAAPETQALSCA